MTSTGRNARLTRLGRRRRSEQGLTLIELLLAVAILTLLTGFLAGGLSIGRRAFDADRTSEIASETDAAIKIISSLIASALPVRTNATNQKSGMVFDGRQNSLSFVALSEGRSLRGGPHKISLRRSGEDFVVDVVGPAAAAARGGPRWLRPGWWRSAGSAKFGSAISAAWPHRGQPVGRRSGCVLNACRIWSRSRSISRTRAAMNRPGSLRCVRGNDLGPRYGRGSAVRYPS